jgi:hypothetical protein
LQTLGPKDYLSLVQISHWFVDQNTENSKFPAIILFTDEVCFIWDGNFINHNSHNWAKEKFAINACESIVLVHEFLNVSCLLPLWLSAHIYWACLEKVLPKLLGNIPLAIRKDMWFHEEEAASHFTRQARKLLTVTYSDRWIRQGGPVAWLPS